MYEFAHNFFYDQETFVLTLIGVPIILFLIGIPVALVMTLPGPPERRVPTPPPPPKYKELSQ